EGLINDYNSSVFQQSLAQIDKDKAIHIAAVNRIFMLAFDYAKIEYEIFHAVNRMVHAFPEDVYTLERGTGLLFYFPQYKGYISTENPFYRFPYAESYYFN